MKLTTKINIYIIFVCIVVISIVKYQSDKQEEYIDFFAKKIIEHKEELFDVITQLKGEPFKRIIEENSLWDDMMRYIETKDPKWAIENINTLQEIHKANCVWLYDAREELIHSVQNINDTSFTRLLLPANSITALFKENKFPHFFIKSKNGLVEVYGASIHPTNDFERKVPSAGYFFVGILWDEEYIKEIEKNMNCSVNVLFPGDKDTVNNNPAIKTFSKIIYYPLDKKEIAKVIVSKNVSALLNMEHIPKKIFGGILVLFAFFILITGFMFWVWIVIPLRKISDSLNYSDAKYIEKVVKDKSVFGNIAKMVIEFFRQKKEIESSEKKFKDMFENHSAVMLLIDPITGNIVDANRSSEEFYKYNYDKLISMNIGDIDIQSKEDLKIELGKSSNSDNNYFVYKHKLADGKIRDVEVYSKPIIVNDKKVLFLIVHDITERKIAEKDLVETKNHAEKEALMKAQFLSNMSHEIRTPLNAIIGLSNLMINETDLDETKRENLKAIKFSADHLHAIINDILDFSKIEAGKVTLEKIDFNVRELVTNAVKTLELQAKEKNLYLKATFGDKIPEVLIGDPVRLNQIIINLVGNAVKFTEVGGVEVKVEINKNVNGKIFLNFKVCDTGIGLSAKRIETIFESFTQAYVDTTRKYGGTGLGLAITKKLVELYGGEVKVESEVGKGSTFSFNTAFGISERKILKPTEKPIKYSDNLSGIKLLLAEDNAVNQFFAKQLFSKWEINFDVANNGLEAVAFLKKNDYDIVLLDLQMPEMNGFEVVEFIRNKDSEIKNHDIPVIALTADISPDTKANVFSSGMDDFVLKPFEQRELCSKISKFINR